MVLRGSTCAHSRSSDGAAHRGHDFDSQLKPPPPPADTGPVTTAPDPYAGNLERSRDESYATDVDPATRPESARATVERALAEARSSLEEALTAAERLIEEQPAVPAGAEQFDRIEHDREALRVAASYVRERERALVAAWRELEGERRAFEHDRAELIQQALDNGYSLGLAESSPANEVVRRRDWGLTPPGAGNFSRKPAVSPRSNRQ